MNLILKRRKKAPMKVRESSVIKCDAHLRWCRGFSCCIEGKSDHVCQGKMEAHHVREGRHGGMNIKHDDTAVPLCSLAHKTFHDMGQVSFRAKYGVDLIAIAAELWSKSPHRIRYERNRE